MSNKAQAFIYVNNTHPESSSPASEERMKMNTKLPLPWHLDLAGISNIPSKQTLKVDLDI